MSEDVLAKLLTTKQEEITLSNGMTVKIKPLTLRETSAILKYAKDDVGKMIQGMVLHGMIEPKLSPEQVDKLPTGVALEIATKVAELSGLGREEREKIENLSERTL